MKLQKFVGICPTCEMVCLQVEVDDVRYQCINCTWIWKPKDKRDKTDRIKEEKMDEKFFDVDSKRDSTNRIINCVSTHACNYCPNANGDPECKICHRVDPSLWQNRQSIHMDTVNHPVHYGSGTYEVINVIEAWDLGFNLGNAVKYIARAGKKDDYQEDLKKAIWYLQREVATVRWEGPTGQVWFDPYGAADE